MSESGAASDEIPIFGAAGPGPRLELLLGGGPDDPFVRLNDSGRFSTVLLGRVASGTDTTVRLVVFKIQRNSYRLAQPAGLTRVTNADIDDLWARKRNHLLPGGSSGIVAPFDLGESFAHQRPITFCRESKKYFHPLCPQCAEILEDCRDDGLLREHGLPAYSESALRYLHCRKCAAAGGTLTVYTYSLPDAEEHPGPKTVIRRREELYRDMEALLRPDLPEEIRARVARLFPCVKCAHRSSQPGREAPAAPPGRAIEASPGQVRIEGPPEDGVLVPLSYHEFHAMALEPLELHYDELVDLLGGASWKDVRARAVEQAGASGREHLLAPLDAALSSPFQWLHEHDPTGLFPLEVLRLKLIAFTQLCRALRDYHARFRKPHLDLGPRSVMASVPPPGTDLPARWHFQVKIIDPGSAFALEAPGEGELDGEALVPIVDAPPEYISPAVRQASLAREELFQLTVRALRPAGNLFDLEVEAISPKRRIGDYRPGDVVRVRPASRAGWLEGAAVWGRVERPLAEGLALTLRTPKGASPTGSFRTPSDFEANVAFYKRFDIPCDLYSVGMLLFRTILVNDGQDSFAVEEAVRRALNKVNDAIAARGTGTDRLKIAGHLQWQMDVEKAVFGRHSVLYARKAREGRSAEDAGKEPSPTDPRPLNRIPPRLWSELVLLGFRFVSTIPGFSYHGSAPEETRGRSELIMDQALRDLDVLSARVHVELFSREARDMEIARACRELAGELEGPEAGGGSPALAANPGSDR